MVVYSKMDRMKVIRMKLVPQRGCRVLNFCAFSGVRGRPASWQYTVLCSEPWYWKVRRMSGTLPTAQM